MERDGRKLPTRRRASLSGRRRPHRGARRVGQDLGARIAGIQAAVHGAIRELVARCADESPTEFDVVAAGTGATALAAALPEIGAVHPDATLWGVYVAATEPAD